MFDSNLTRENALMDIDDGMPAHSLDICMDEETIALSRQSSELREQCFRSRETFDVNYALLTEHIRRVDMRHMNQPLIQFFMQSAPRYRQSLPAAFDQPVAFTTVALLMEILSNAMAVSDNVRIRMDITTKGLLIDVNQGSREIPPAHIETVRIKAKNILEGLLIGKPMDELMQDCRASIVRAIGYVPPDTTEMDISPFRGNGTSNMLICDCLRVNYASIAAEYHTLALSTLNQVANAIRFQQGDRSMLSRLYGPSEVAMDTTVVDEIFEDFDFKDLL